MSLNRVPPTDTTSTIEQKEACMIANVQRAVFTSTRWLTTEELSKFVGLKEIDFRIRLNNWKSNNQIFTIESEGIEYLPEYAFNLQEKYRPIKILIDIIAVFGNSKNGWGIAYWFASNNGYLGGRRPQDLLIAEPDAVLEAAKDEQLEICHG